MLFPVGREYARVKVHLPDEVGVDDPDRAAGEPWVAKWFRLGISISSR